MFDQINIQFGRIFTDDIYTETIITKKIEIIPILNIRKPKPGDFDYPFYVQLF